MAEGYPEPSCENPAVWLCQSGFATQPSYKCSMKFYALRVSLSTAFFEHTPLLWLALGNSSLCFGCCVVRPFRLRRKLLSEIRGWPSPPMEGRTLAFKNWDSFFSCLLSFAELRYHRGRTRIGAVLFSKSVFPRYAWPAAKPLWILIGLKRTNPDQMHLVGVILDAPGCAWGGFCLSLSFSFLCCEVFVWMSCYCFPCNC